MKINTVNYFISDAFKSLRRNKTISLASVITVLITFSVLGIFTLVAKNANLAIGGVESKIELKVYLLDDVKLIDQREIEVKLREQDGVKEIEYESREQALKNFEDMMKDTPGLLEGYTLKNNPLPASYIVRLTDPSYAEAISEAVQDLPGVESIGNQQDVINQIHSIVKVVRVVGIVLFIILIGVSIFLIMNTTKLTVYSRRREVGIMKFVGATDWFIRWPFIIEGMVIGLLGAILSVIGVYFIYRFGVGIIANNILMVSLINPTYVLTMLSW
ncbi:MAG: permease-like cell division protein FtsX, partial [Clostridium sp.]|nr:permease-like cell division protein FtsX [Clostridium sp.]